MRKVLHFKTGPYLPVTENWIYGQISGLKKYEAIVYACNSENLSLFPVNKIRTTSFLKGARRGLKLRKIFFYLFFLYFLAKDKPNVVHAHFGPSGQRFLPLKRIINAPLITTFYGYDVNQIVHAHPRWLNKYQRLFQNGTLFLVEGSHMKKSLAAIGCPEDKILIQHLGVDVASIRLVPRKISQGEEIRILMAASFREKKGIPYGVDAFGRLKNMHPQVKASLTIIGDSAGDAVSEEQKRLILNQIERHHIKTSVKMMGYQSHEVFIRELYNHHIFLAPSVHASDGDNEGGSPVSIIEASSSGIPVLSTYHCDIPEVVLDGKSGYLVPERDAASLVNKLESLAFNVNAWPEMGNNGRRHVEQNYDVRRQIELLEDIYDRVASGEYAKH